ncbi:retrovirus-related pol polyprotein from transposon TNT 1-94, partial [Tanacetum coccineum]
FVAQGYTQVEGIDYDKVFAPVARIEAIRLLLAYASFKDFVVNQMDVKSDFLYGKIDEIKKVNANYILMANLLQASTSGTQTDKALVYDSDRSAEVHDYDNCYNNEIFNMFTQEEQYTELLKPILEPHQVQ